MLQITAVVCASSGGVRLVDWGYYQYYRKNLHAQCRHFIIPSSLPTLSTFYFFLLFPQTHSGETWGRITKLMGGPEGEFPAPWFANRGLVPLSFPCNRGSGLWSLPSPPVRGLTKCTDCTLCVLVKARLPSLWRLGTGKEDRGPRCGWEKRLKLLTYGFFVGQFPSSLGIVEGTSLKITWSRPKVLFTCGCPTMEMQRWSTRWKTKRWLMDSTVTAFITLILVLQATNVSAGKIIRDQTSLMKCIWPKGDGAVAGWENSVTDDGDWGINRFTWTPRRHVRFVVKFTCVFSTKTTKVVTARRDHSVYLHD